MPRRKRVLDDGDDSDSSVASEENDVGYDNNPVAREERALFEDPYQRKRRRTNGKEDALYGIFGEDSDEDISVGRNPARKKNNWAKAPAFVSGDKKVESMDIDQADEGDNEDGPEEASLEEDNDDDGTEGEDEVDEEDNNSDTSEPSRPPSPRGQVENEDDVTNQRTRMGGIGSTTVIPSLTKGGIGSSRPSTSAFAKSDTGNAGFPKGGIGSKPTAVPVDKSPDNTGSPPSGGLPSAFGQRFSRGLASTSTPTVLSASERAHFNKIQGTFGARMLAKMGWEAGSGLGTAGEGIVTPIESKLRPQKMGIAFKGFKEKTEQSKAEARRRGEVVSDDEDEKTKKFRKKVKEQEQKRSDIWKRPKKVKTKVEHKTYEQIIAEAGQEPATSGIGQIIDATGAVPREVSSLADVSLNTWSTSADPTRIPEVRHNIKLIAEGCKNDLDGLAREAKALAEKKKWIASEDARLRKKVDDEVELIARLQQIQLVANDIQAMSKELASVYEVSLDPFSPLFYKLVDQFPLEFDRYHLDDIVVAAIAPLLRRMVAQWNPLKDSTAFISTFRGWRRALKVNPNDEKLPQTQVDVYGSQTVTSSVDIEKPMTPFESLLWNVWLPKVRTSINNEWSPEDPQPAIKLYESWSTFLPPFIRDNFLDQLILPKVQKAVSDWNQKRANVPLQSIVFPWLPHVGLRLDDVVGDAKRKIKALLRSWTINDAKPSDLLAWRELFDTNDWDSMILKYIVPKLGATLRNDLHINPRDQKMEPLHHVLAWSGIIRSSIFSQIFETEFFPKWLDVLYIWLVQPRVSFEEVAQWYSFWKSSFPEDIQNMAGISRGFTRALQLMNNAIELGPDAPTQLVRPDFRAEISAPTTPVRAAATSKAPVRPSARTHEITFRSIVEENAAGHNLLLIPTGRAHEKSRMPLFRVSSSANGRGGLLIYILDDAVWAPKSDALSTDSDDFIAISLDEMISRAM